MSDNRSPVDIVVTTTELLESTLLQLDMRSLLTSALGVCRQWRDLIRTSPSLRRALFLDSDNTQTFGDDEQTVTYNPLMAELFPPLFNSGATPDTHGFDDLTLEALPIGRRTRAFYRPNASWRRMHVRRPPVQHVAAWTLFVGMAKAETMRMVRYPAGLRMEGLYSLALGHACMSRCCIAWGESQGRLLRPFALVEEHMRGLAEEVVRGAEVVIAATGGGTCMDDEEEEEEGAREYKDVNGNVTIGSRRFRIKVADDWSFVWDKEDFHLWD
ncbi:unnamed protein product [Discula destructiva]